MRYLLLLIAFGAQTTLTSTLFNYELEGHFSVISANNVPTWIKDRAKFLAYEKNIRLELSTLLDGNITELFVDNFEVHGVDRSRPTLIFHGYFTTLSNITRQQIIDLIDISPDLTLYYLAPLDYFPQRYSLVDSELVKNFTCQNGGILLPNSTCVCPGFISGRQCEIINCQHFGILNENRCSCPPGAYALYCEPRGCMPSVQDNMDTTTRSFILVLNLKSSMGYDLDVIIVQVEAWVKNINKVAPNLIENYILTTYLESKNGFYMKNNVFTTMNDLISYLNGVVISSGLSDQPTLAAINSAQSFTYLMRPMSNVHVFADSPSSDDTSTSLYISSNTTELQLIQRTLSWRNKIIIVLSETKERPLDTFGDEYDVFKRVVRATHGDLLLIRKAEIENVINKLFPYFYQMENIAVRYQTMNMTLENVLIKADSLTQPVNILVNVDQEKILPSITDTNNTLTEVIKGEYFALYRTFMNRTSEINISTISDVNIRIWINSAYTGYLAYSANPEIDVGSAVTISELPSYITGYVTGFTDIKRFSQSTLNLLGYTIEQEISAEIRSSECTFSYQFPPRPTCTPGPFVQLMEFIDNENTTFYRVIPGFCVKPDYPTVTPFICLHNGTQSGVRSCNCTNTLFEGQNCGIPVCLNGGNVEKFPGNGRSLCKCPRGYTGNHCENLSCDIPSSDTFDIYDRTLAVVLQNSFSQAEVNRNISSGLHAFLGLMGKDDAFTNYVVTTFNTLTVEGEQQIAVSSRTFKTASEFLNATSSASVQYKHSQSFTQPSLDALLQTINVVKYNKSSIFLFTDATPNVDNNDISSIVLAAVERQLEINIVITAPYLMNDFCIKAVNSSIYAQLAIQTGGNIVNLCRPHQNYPRDLIVEFFTGYGISHHHVETLQEKFMPICSKKTNISFFIDDPTADSFVFINSDTVENFAVKFVDNDLSDEMKDILPSTDMPFFSIYELSISPSNKNGYTIEVMQGSDSENGSCNVRVVEKSLLTVFVGFSPDPAIDKYSATMTYASPASPVIHIGSQLQSDPRVTLQITNNEGITLYSSTDEKRKPTCHYEGYFTTPFVCANPYDIYFITTTLWSKELVVQRSKRAYCYIAPGQCLHGGVYIRDKCQCTSQYEGQSCENPICLNKGSMKNFSCECGPSFTGTNCEFGTCYDWNYIETNDVRQHEFRQITFVVETTNIMILPMVFLKHLITNFVASAEDNNIPKQFSLITFDEKSVWKVISTSHPEEFIATFSKVMTLPTINSNNSALSVQAINEAYKITIQPPSIIYVFTASSAITRNRLYLKQRLGTQVNIMYISPGVVPAQPTSYQLPMIARQSGGRILPITSYNMDNIEPVLTSMLKENALIYDDAAKDCTQGWSTSFLVESEITSLVLIITGSSVSQSGAATIMDGEGQTVTPSKTLLYDIASLIIEIDLTKATAVRGNWTVTIKTSGSCFLQARAITPIHVIPGFTSDPRMDFVKSGPFSGLKKNRSVYMTFRVYNNYEVILKQVEISQTDLSEPWQDKRHLLTVDITPRDPLGCSSQFITKEFVMPSTSYQKFVVTGVVEHASFSSKFQRTMFFAMPNPKDTNSLCVSGVENDYGECICNESYSGDYCTDRICQNGGTPSLTTCVCPNGYYGENCEKFLAANGTRSIHSTMNDKIVINHI